MSVAQEESCNIITKPIRKVLSYTHSFPGRILFNCFFCQNDGIHIYKLIPDFSNSFCLQANLYVCLSLKI